MKIAIASGKGGTGKTTIAVNLFYFLSQKTGDKVQLIDCDVEEPNDLLFFKSARKKHSQEVFTLVPKIDTDKCTYCKKCSEWCEFNAITIVKNLVFTDVSNDLCHSCGACSVACGFGAIAEHPRPLGVISEYSIEFGARVIEGRLEIGSALQTSLIKKVKKYAEQAEWISLFDAPPGTSCPVVETVSDADYIILVTEPTPFGLYDLQLTIELIRELKIPFGVIVNKAGLGSKLIYKYLEENNIELIGNIPFSKAYASRYSKGELLQNLPEEMAGYYEQTVEKILSITKVK